MNLKIGYTAQLWREGNQFIAHAMPLDVASSGETPELARQALDEAVRLFLTTASEHGTLEEMLQDAGYQFDEGEWNSPEIFAVERNAAVLSV